MRSARNYRNMSSEIERVAFIVMAIGMLMCIFLLVAIMCRSEMRYINAHIAVQEEMSNGIEMEEIRPSGDSPSGSYENV